MSTSLSCPYLNWISLTNFTRGGRDRMVVGSTTTYAINADAVSSNLDQGEVYNIM